MRREKFNADDFKENMFLAVGEESKFTGGQVTIVGGSRLFHGAPILALKAASRIVSMAFFASPVEDKGVVDKIKSSLGSFIWVSLDDLDSYMEKSDAVLIGPGLMRSHAREKGFVCDSEGESTRRLTLKYIRAFPKKKWLIDGGSLQVIRVDDLPEGAAITPNRKEWEMLFGEKMAEKLNEREDQIMRLADKYKIVVLAKDEVSLVSDGKRLVRIEGGNEGLVKGGVGDVIAGAAVGLMAKNDALFSLAAASFLVKKAAEKLAKRRDFMFNADDVAEKVPEIYGEIMKSIK